jgi:putative hemolysin
MNSASRPPSKPFSAWRKQTSAGTAERIHPLELCLGRYCARLACTQREREAAFRLRFRVFNLELNEGLSTSYETGRDTDEYDAGCDHLIVEDSATGEIVGTYRLQTGAMAARNIGYYSEREFDFAPYEPLRSELVELGRACVHRDCRGASAVLELLWKGIARYAVERGARYLIGCSSLSTQDAAHGARVCQILKEYAAAPSLQTLPQPGLELPPASTAEACDHIPKLLRTYLAVGARICGPPAIDREFQTIDFLTLLDLDALHPRLRSRFLK